MLPGFPLLSTCSAPPGSCHGTAQLGLTGACSNVPLPAGPTAPTSNQQENTSNAPAKHTPAPLCRQSRAPSRRWQHAINFQEPSLLQGQDSRNVASTVGMASAQAAHPKAHVPLCWGTPVLTRHLPRDVDIPGHQTGSQLYRDDDTSLSSLPPQSHLPGAGFVPLPMKPPRQKERIPPADSPRLPFVLLQHLATTQCQGRAPRSVVWIKIPDLCPKPCAGPHQSLFP